MDWLSVRQRQIAQTHKLGTPHHRLFTNYYFLPERSYVRTTALLGSTRGCHAYSLPWTARAWAEFRYNNLTRSSRDILLTLRTFRGSGGLCMPSHATLADRAKCSVRTVQRALKQADYLGLVRWAERRVRAAWRWLRTSNRYLFEIPEMPVIGGLRLLRRRPIATTGHSVRRGE